MNIRQRITTLNDLFYALFRGEGKEEPAIQGYPRLAREDYFQMFFPDVLCQQYLGKTKSNLTWFFNDDVKNKAIKRSLIRMLTSGVQPVLRAVHQKCRAVLWPNAQHPAFRRDSLWAAFSAIYIPSSLNAKLYITEQAGIRAKETPRLRRFFDADPASAMARVVLTLAVASDASEDLITRIWSTQESDAALYRNDTSVEGHIRQGNLLYISGQREKAFCAFEQAAKQLSRPAETLEESELYGRMGLMLATGDGHFQDEAAARHYLELGCLEENPKSFYLLAKHTSGESSRSALKKAASLGYIPAVREMGNAWYYGLGCKSNMEQAKQCFQQGLSDPSEDGAYCAYILGRIYEGEDALSSAITAYRIAAGGGNPEAGNRLTELNHFEDTAAPALDPAGLDSSGGFCLTNGLTGANQILAGSLGGGWQITHVGQEQDFGQSLRALAEKVFLVEGDAFPELVISLLSENQRDNLYQAVNTLRILEEAVRPLGIRRWKAAQAVRIYVRAEHDSSALMLDAAFSGLRGITFSLRLCDPAWDSADQLFSAAPLFLPCLRNPSAEAVNIVVLGTSRTAMAAIQRAIALPLPENHPVSIHVFGDDADEMEQRFWMCCPGMEDTALCRCIPQFHRCDLENGQIFRLLRELKRSRQMQKETPGGKTAELLLGGNYFIVAVGDDQQNIDLAARLRAELLKMDSSFSNLPFIAVQVQDPTTAWLAGNMAENNRVHSWHSRYDLFCYGSEEQYTYKNLKEDVLEKRAMALHLHYSGENQPQNTAITTYFSRQYSRDSSRALALYAPYRLFAAGIALPDWRLYGIPDEAAKLAEPYRRYLLEDAHLEDAARLEHTRWNCFMLSTGWEPATVSQVETYVQRGNPSHQLYLCKLHPFLCTWEELASGERLRRVAEAVHSRLPEKTVQDPRLADAETVRYTPLLLSIR